MSRKVTIELSEIELNWVIESLDLILDRYFLLPEEYPTAVPTITTLRKRLWVESEKLEAEQAHGH